MRGSRQAVVVTTPDWNSTSGTLQRYERSATGWRAIGDPFPVVIGRSGMGWGLGVAPVAPGEISDIAAATDPVKKEGDGRSPAGVFPIGPAFGFADTKPDNIKLPYIPLTSATECVDDAKSFYYNALVDRLSLAAARQPGGQFEAAPDWTSSEKMRQIAVYQWGAVVDQNSNRQHGAGSCIFLHIWNGPQSHTAGCTAMDQTRLEQLLGWLDPAAKPVLVTLPASEYHRLRSQWNLP
jgi:D-alanyl-D-alanine dipeptidase